MNFVHCCIVLLCGKTCVESQLDNVLFRFISIVAQGR